MTILRKTPCGVTPIKLYSGSIISLNVQAGGCHDFVHEYGYYIHVQEMGMFTYTFFIAISSEFDVVCEDFLYRLEVIRIILIAHIEMYAFEKGDDYKKNNMHTPKVEK